MKLRWARIGTDYTSRGPRGVYRSSDGRFTIMWADRQGARGTWNVGDSSKGSRTLRADTLAEAKETAYEISRGDSK